jgi:hypothetical protein
MEFLDVGTTEMYEIMTEGIDIAFLINELDLQQSEKH